MPRVGGRAGRVGRAVGRRLLIRLIIFGVIAIIGVVIWLFNQHSDPGNAGVGDCIGNLPDASNSSTAVDADNAKKIDCTDSSAQFKVVGVVNDPTGNEINNDAQVGKDCGGFTGFSTAFEEYSQDNSGDDSDGTLLCLEPVKH
jgi:hypothetical protein